MTKTASENISEPIFAFWLWIGWFTVLITALCLFAASLIFGNLNQDEGWYLYAAGLISSGKIPYRDFAFMQGPVMPFVYSLADPVIKWGGLSAGRFLTAILGMAGALIAALLASRLARPGQSRLAAILCLILSLLNVYQVYFCTVVKTYSLTIFFMTSALWALHHALIRRNIMAVMLAAVLLVLAAGTRTSAAVVLPIIFGLLWLERSRFTFPAWLYFALGAIVAAALVFGPFLVQCSSNFIYFVMRYHTLRHEGNLLAILMFKAGFVSRVLQAYFLCFGLWIAALTVKRLRQKEDIGAPEHAAAADTLLLRALWICGLAVSLVHFFAPFPYDDYQVFIYPFFAVAVSVMLLKAMPERGGKWVLAAVLFLSLSAAISSPLNQEWFIEGRDLIWWRTKDQPPLLKLRQTADKIRSLCKPGDMLLTQDPYLAVESGCVLPHGLEMGQFSYFPDLTREAALKLNVLNRDLLAELLQNCPAPLAALSGYALSIQAPQITPVPSGDKSFFMAIVEKRYDLFTTVTNFGQASTTLRLYRKNSDQ